MKGSNYINHAIQTYAKNSNYHEETHGLVDMDVDNSHKSYISKIKNWFHKNMPPKKNLPLNPNDSMVHSSFEQMSTQSDKDNFVKSQVANLDSQYQEKDDTINRNLDYPSNNNASEPSSVEKVPNINEISTLRPFYEDHPNNEYYELLKSLKDELNRRKNTYDSLKLSEVVREESEKKNKIANDSTFAFLEALKQEVNSKPNNDIDDQER